MQFDPKLNPDAAGILRDLFKFKAALLEKGAFSKDEFLKGFKKIGIPSNAHFWLAVRNCELPIQKCKLLTRIGRDSFVFTKPKDPIHHADLQAICNFYRGLENKYAQTQKEKKRRKKAMDEFLFGDPEPNEDQKKIEEAAKRMKEHSKAENPQLPQQIREAIDLLKSHGFEVLAPIATLYAKM